MLVRDSFTGCGKCLTTLLQGLKPKKAKRLISELKLRPPGVRRFFTMFSSALVERFWIWSDG